MKKILVLSLVFALILTMVLPTVAMAARPAVFNASGTFSAIDTGTVKQLGDSNYWLVKNRHITGLLNETSQGITEGFTITYGGVFNINTQAGALAGNLKTDTKTFVVSGQVAPLEMVDVGGGQYLPRLSISGHWSGIKGVKDTGTFKAWVVFRPDPDGHVGEFVGVFSEFMMISQHGGGGGDQQ